MAVAAAAALVFLGTLMGLGPSVVEGPAAARAQTVAPASPSLTIVALGDSLTSGHQLPAAQAYPALLQKELDDARLPFTIVNHGVSGDTTAGGLRRLDKALAENPQILIVELGANDGLRGVPVAQVRTNLETIIETAQKRGITVLLCAMDALPINGWQYTLDFHNLYFDLADKYKVPLVPFLLGNILGNRELMSSDGVHPNREGAKVLAETIWPYLRPLAETAAAGIQNSKAKIQN